MSNILSNFEKPIVPETPALVGKQTIFYNNIEEELEEFYKVYRNMPQIINSYGMQSPHLFLLWHALKQLSPKYVIESGVYKGLGTWWIEQACPNAKIYSIDVDFSNVEYKSENVTYFNEDFSKHSWEDIDKENTIIFFDDHQNALERLMQMKWMGFSKAIFDDNYASYSGDCYSCKKILANTGNQWGWDMVEPNAIDSYFLRENIVSYQEFPAPFKWEKTRFGFEWTEKSMFSNPITEVQKLLYQEAAAYTYMCYVELK